MYIMVAVIMIVLMGPPGSVCPHADQARLRPGSLAWCTAATLNTAAGPFLKMKPGLSNWGKR